MKIIETIQINEKNTRTTQTGKKVTSFKAYPFDFYIGGIFLPDFVNFGDVVTIYITKIEVGEYNGKPQYNAKFAQVSKETLLSNSEGGNAPQAPASDLFGGQEIEVDDSALPF